MAITSIPLGAHLPCYSRDLPRLLCGLLGWSAFSVPWVSLAWVGFVKKRSWQSLRLSHRHLLPLVVATQGLAANLVRDGGCSTTCSKSEALAANPHRLLACRHLLVHLLPAHNRSSTSSLSFILSKSQQQAILAHSLCHSLFLTQHWPKMANIPFFASHLRPIMASLSIPFYSVLEPLE